MDQLSWRKTESFFFWSRSTGGPINLQTLTHIHTHTHTMPRINNTHAHKVYLLTQTFSNVHTIKEHNNPRNLLVSHCQLSEEGKKKKEAQSPEWMFHSNQTLLVLGK